MAVISTAQVAECKEQAENTSLLILLPTNLPIHISSTNFLFFYIYILD